MRFGGYLSQWLSKQRKNKMVLHEQESHLFQLPKYTQRRHPPQKLQKLQKPKRKELIQVTVFASVALKQALHIILEKYWFLMDCGVVLSWTNLTAHMTDKLMVSGIFLASHYMAFSHRQKKWNASTLEKKPIRLGPKYQTFPKRGSSMMYVEETKNYTSHHYQ